MQIELVDFVRYGGFLLVLIVGFIAGGRHYRRKAGYDRINDMVERALSQDASTTDAAPESLGVSSGIDDE